MSYRCGLAPAVAHLMRVRPGGPCIVCDGCGLIRSVETRGGLPAKWFIGRYLDGKPAPGWTGHRNEDGTRHDLCGECSP